MKTFKQYLLELGAGGFGLNHLGTDPPDVPGEEAQSGPEGTSIMFGIADTMKASNHLLRLGIVPESDHIHHWHKAFETASNVIITGNHGNETMKKMTVPQKMRWLGELHDDILKQHSGTAVGLLQQDDLRERGMPLTLKNLAKYTPPPPSKKIDFK